MLTNLNHHAYCIIGSNSVSDKVKSFLEKEQNITIQSNPDIFEHFYEVLTIDDAKELKNIHQNKPVSDDGKRFFILTVNAIPIEAQNALLKLLEEPAPYAHFFLIIPSLHILLPTVVSRLCFVDMGIRNNKNDEVLAEKFLKMSVAKRLEFVKKMIDEIADEKRPKNDAVELLNAIQNIVYKEKSVVKGFRSLRAIELACQYSTDRSPSLKILLEFVALNVL